MKKMPGKILLVEDNADDEALTIRAFRKSHLGNEIDVVRDGAEALDYLFSKGAYSDKDHASKVDLILLDLKLPKISGLEVLRQLKADPKLKKIPVVILTTSKEDKDVEHAYNYGVNSYVIKPVEMTDFMASIQKLEIYWMVINQNPEKWRE